MATTDIATITPPSVPVPDAQDSPVKVIKADDLKMIGDKLSRLFMEYVSDRRIAELRWLRNQRQYLGIYDPEIEKELNANRSKAYPRVTRVKCISVLSRLMNLMFQGTERNWQLTADPSPDLKVSDVVQAIADAQKADAASTAPGTPAPPAKAVDLPYVMAAIKTLSEARAKALSDLIDDQLMELGGDQSEDYVTLNRDVVRSGVIYGMGVLRGPYVRKSETAVWSLDATGQPSVKKKTVYKPLFEALSIWDFYPDMSAKTLKSMDGYFTRTVMTRHQVRDLAKRSDFFADQIKKYLNNNKQGNYRPQPYETELRAMGVKVNVNEMKPETLKYEVISWHGPISGEWLQMCGCDVPEGKLTDDIDAEVWMIDGNVIKCDINPWRKIDADVQTIHTFLFDEDDTSPVGMGLPNVIRDTQMAISAATRMLLDNASVICGPNLELNTDLLLLGQDLSSTAAYKVWYREGSGPDAQFPAVRNVEIESHLDELMKVIDLFMKFADMETFVGPATGGDMSQTPSEPMRTAAGASMLRGDAALPFKDIVRNFDSFTMSVIQSVVEFNRKFNPDQAPDGDYNVIARGATSLIAKEVRGMQVDQLASSLQPEEKMHVDMRKLIEARFATRDLTDLLKPQVDVDRDQAAASAKAAQDQQSAQALQEANTRKLLADAFKNIAQGNKSATQADVANIDASLKLLENGVSNGGPGGSIGQGQAGGGPAGPAQGEPGQLGVQSAGGPPPAQAGAV